MNYWPVIASALLVLAMIDRSAGYQHSIMDDRMDKMVAKFANFKDVVNLNLFLYELLSMMSDVSPAYGTVNYYHNIQHPSIPDPSPPGTTET
ncbi:hypothetical protein ZHAS_00013680 [Anopheles sinensis]|uniref:Uncharacterized protein n=1 Tax=Anopheles sinensis TaxID=74873 RepID=A0A084W6H4_ANOSI|nr:hypothetical protein ZHAS_00013680 [Anopheles sinensis]